MKTGRAARALKNCMLPEEVEAWQNLAPILNLAEHLRNVPRRCWVTEGLRNETPEAQTTTVLKEPLPPMHFTTIHSSCTDVFRQTTTDSLWQLEVPWLPMQSLFPVAALKAILHRRPLPALNLLLSQILFPMDFRSALTFSLVVASGWKVAESLKSKGIGLGPCMAGGGISCNFCAGALVQGVG